MNVIPRNETDEITLQRPHVLFICTHNSARSQMAEGYLRTHYGDLFEVGSGGTEPGSTEPLGCGSDGGDRD